MLFILLGLTSIKKTDIDVYKILINDFKINNF